jgi:N-acetylneuraminic acid mutarotase
MVVWGGYDYASGTYKNDGGIYDPATDKWKAMAAAPSTIVGRSQMSVVWSTTTSEMIVWGGYSSSCSSYACVDGAAYDPAKDSWRTLVGAPIAGRWKATAVWTGSEMIIWGGAAGSSTSYPSPVFKDGARFDPKTNVWTKFPDPAVDLDGRLDNAGVWTGKELLIYGGFGAYISPTYGKRNGARYIPGGSWTTITAPLDSDLATPTRFAMASWYAGGKLWVWAGGNGSSSSGIAVAGGATYDPATDKWASMDVTDAPTARSRPSVVWTGKEAIIWGGSNYASGSTFYSDGKVYRP